ncbi:bifunctional homocysteine S-methyltransferase/methylenetetrahydrofolate reductase [Kamptonema cortianum]|nr:bifunctional homocysteine S-methyltransferase/methylenetetrahydrofolate reductase [Kamptonema cortianum]MDL5049741.1 bifunctional homocysteine S-methyltransferase/methylenetetrahydrofolate reductase [Oscillatoria amoena NRMC-F 0135]
MMSNLLQMLETRVVIGDGAMGTRLFEKGIPCESCLEELNLTRPDIVAEVHREYLNAGADLIETNTFGANFFRLYKHGLHEKVGEINRAASQIAREQVAREGKGFVGGSVGPTGMTEVFIHEKADEVANTFREQIAALVSGGVDALMLETFTRPEEILIAIRAAKQIAPETPVIALVTCGESMRFSTGESVVGLFEELEKLGAAMVGFNCLTGPRAALNILKQIPLSKGRHLAVFPNAGRPEFHDGRFHYETPPEYFAAVSKRFLEEGVSLIGGCCGTTPEHIRALAAAIGSVSPVRKKHEVTGIVDRQKLAMSSPFHDESILDIVTKRTLIVTELDPPKTMNTAKFIEGAKALKAAGTDAVTLADNSLAILRISNLAMGVLTQQAGVMPILHLACRDRNILGLQSELMGMSALGIHHVLALTGDPAKVGDHPEATSVYDVASVALIQMIKRLNEGFNHAGKDIKKPTRFVIGCAFNPNARNIDSQVRKLEQKVAAGAQFAMTQPVFDPALVRLTYEKTKHIGIPVLVGVMPLIGARNAEFLHNEVPGISIPDNIRERMRGREGDDALPVSHEICVQIASEILTYFKGIYLITPLLRYEMTAELSRWVREQEK